MFTTETCSCRPRARTQNMTSLVNSQWEADRWSQLLPALNYCVCYCQSATTHLSLYFRVLCDSPLICWHFTGGVIKWIPAFISRLWRYSETIGNRDGCLYVSVNGGELFDDLVSRESYSESDARLTITYLLTDSQGVRSMTLCGGAVLQGHTASRLWVNGLISFHWLFWLQTDSLGLQGIVCAFCRNSLLLLPPIA